MRSLLIASIFAGACAFCAEDAPLDAAAVERLAATLGDDDFDAREAAAEKLIGCGEQVWPLLEPHLKTDSPEQRERLRRIANLMGIVLEDQKPALDRLLCDLLYGDACNGCDGLLNLGPLGLPRVQDALTGKGAHITLACEKETYTAQVGGPCEIPMTVTNTGTAPYWVGNGSGSGYSFIHVPFGAERNGPRRGAMGSSRFGCGSRISHPLAYWRRVSPGEFNNLRISVQCPNPGVSSVRPSYSIRSRALELAANNAVHKFEMNASLVYDPAPSVQVFTLPSPLWQIGRDKPLEMNLEVKAPATGGCWQVQAALQSTLDASAVRLEAEFLRYAWYVLLNDAGTPVHWGALDSVLADTLEDSDALAAQDIPPEQELCWTLSIPTPGTAGKFSLLIGYEINANEHAADFDLIDQKGKILFDLGNLYARLDGLEVKPDE